MNNVKKFVIGRFLLEKFLGFDGVTAADGFNGDGEGLDDVAATSGGC